MVLLLMASTLCTLLKQDGGFELVEGDIAADASADNQGEQGDAAQANAHPLVDWQSADDDDIEEEDTRCAVCIDVHHRCI